MLNLKATHRVSTSVRLAMEKAVSKLLHKGSKITPVMVEVADSLGRGAGSIRVPGISIDVTTKTWKQLKQIGAV